MQRPLRFQPFLRPMVWGGRRLGKLLGKALPTSDAYGESWEVSDHSHHHSVVAQGQFAGRTLHELMQTHRRELLGPSADQYQTFPWLIKYLDAADWLSVQVHPDEKAVRWLWPGEGSKTEVWFILDASPESRIYAGLRTGTTPAQLLAAVKQGSVTEVLHSFAPRPGDCVFLPAGTVHAVGGGVLLAEIQQTSDATFRLFDWNRKDADGRSRPLHLAESLASTDWSRGPVEPVRVETQRGAALVDCCYFRLEHMATDRAFPCGGNGRLRSVIILSGEGMWYFSGEEIPFRTGETWILPASLPSGECRPHGDVTLLAATLP